MRTTVRLDPEVAAAAERLRRERHIGLGEAVKGAAQERMLRGLGADWQQPGLMTFLEAASGVVLALDAALDEGIVGQVGGLAEPGLLGPEAPRGLVGRAPQDDGRLGGGDTLGAPGKPRGAAL